MHSILHPAREPYLVWLMFESKCYKKLEHCLCFFSLLTLQSSTWSGTFSFLTMAVESPMCSPMIRTSVFYKICSYDTSIVWKRGLRSHYEWFLVPLCYWGQRQGGKGVWKHWPKQWEGDGCSNLSSFPPTPKPIPCFGVSVDMVACSHPKPGLKNKAATTLMDTAMFNYFF